jgi:hypothetical protein
MRGIKRRKNMAAAPVEATVSSPGSPNEVPDQAGPVPRSPLQQPL